jgi:hypothetical protein
MTETLQLQGRGEEDIREEERRGEEGRGEQRREKGW